MSSVTRSHARSRRRRRVPRALAAAIPLSLVAIEAHAQTDYYNTDAGRPISVEDAYPIEHRAFELQLAPLRLERAPGGAYAWGIEPELAFGILPRTQVEIGFPLAYADRAGRRSAGLAGIELAALHNLNVETRIPALAVAGEVLLPVGALAPSDPYFSAKGIATRTFRWARFHVNGTYTFGERDRARPAVVPPPGSDPAHDAHDEISRWTAGVAVDRTFPLQSLLLAAELVAREPYIRHGDDDDPELAWETAAGARWQLGPRVVLDGGAGYQLTGDGGWFVTFGAAVSVGLPWRP